MVEQESKSCVVKMFQILFLWVSLEHHQDNLIDYMFQKGLDIPFCP